MKKSKIAAALLLAMSATAMTAAKAETIFYFSNAGLYNGAPLSDTNVFASASFTDVVVNGVSEVKLVMTVLSGLGNSYANDWAFNVGSGSITNVTYSTGSKAKGYQISGISPFGGNIGSGFDLEFNFDTSHPGEITSPGSSTYLLSGTGLTANSFNFLTNNGLYSAVHVQGGGIESSFFSGGTSTDGSGPGTGNPVPEPATIATLGLGMLGLAFARRRNSR